MDKLSDERLAEIRFQIGQYPGGLDANRGRAQELMTHIDVLTAERDTLQAKWDTLIDGVVEALKCGSWDVLHTAISDAGEEVA